MKKWILAVFLLFFIQGFAQQSWVEQGAVWHYGYTGFGAGVHILSYNTDTIIQGKNCQKIEGVRYDFVQSGPPPAPTVSMGPYPIAAHYTYYSGDTVYYLSDDTIFYPLYIFSAQVGDEWTLQNPTDTCCYCTSTNVKITSTDTTTISGQTLRTLGISPANNSNASFNNSGIGAGVFITEKIGVTSSGYLFPLGTICEGVTIWDPTIFYFNCFSSPSLSYQFANDCDELAPIAEILQSNSTFSLYPNPANCIVNINTSYTKPYQLTLLDITGKVVCVENNKTGNVAIAIGILNSGIYILQIQTENGLVTKKLVVE